ncbi:hypothetical protein Q0M94_28260 (plasmid) [Deinococcus radiomollis]|uniref:hypothetical protein n=1 Tax=Deinococcus radiomollis TaxID=468916 RepID=UPI0038917F5B
MTQQDAPMEYNVSPEGAVTPVQDAAPLLPYTTAPNPDPLRQAPVPEATYDPPAPSKEQAAVVTELGDGVLLSVVIDGKRHAVSAATEADARKFLADHPEMCLVS